MTFWSTEDITRIATTDDLHIAPLRADGATYGTFTWIWSVVVDGRLFVRAWNGTQSRWYQSATAQRAGGIMAADQNFDVSFTPADAHLQERIDEAYRVKYAGSSYLPPMLATGPQAATIEITPRDTASSTK